LGVTYPGTKPRAIVIENEDVTAAEGIRVIECLVGVDGRGKDVESAVKPSGDAESEGVREVIESRARVEPGVEIEGGVG